MAAYYNELNSYNAQWIRNLIAAGHIADGEVDDRSVVDVAPDDLRGFRQCHFFAGISVWSLALRLAGWSDEDEVWSGSPPCQPFSKSGKRKGFADDRHLWPAFFDLIRVRRPAILFGEQVPVAIKDGWLDLVKSDLESEGYAFGSLVFRASDVGAPIERKRLYFTAQRLGSRMERQFPGTDPGPPRPWGWRGEADLQAIADAPFEHSDRWPQPIVRRVDAGVAECMGRLHAYGNAINAPAAAAFVRAVMDLRP